MSGCPNFDNNCLSTIIDSACPLEQLRLDQTTNVTDSVLLERLLRRKKKTMKKLTMNGNLDKLINSKSGERKEKGSSTNSKQPELIEAADAQMENKEEEGWWLNCKDLRLTTHTSIGTTQFTWIVFVMCVNECKRIFKSDLDMKKKKKVTEKGKKKDNNSSPSSSSSSSLTSSKSIMLRAVESLFSVTTTEPTKGDNDNDTAETGNRLLLLEDVHLWYQQRQESTEINESDVRFLYEIIEKAHFLEEDMDRNEIEQYEKKYRKKDKRSNKKKKKTDAAAAVANNNTNPSILPQGGKVRPLKVEIVQKLSKALSLGPSHEQDILSLLSFSPTPPPPPPTEAGLASPSSAVTFSAFLDALRANHNISKDSDDKQIIDVDMDVGIINDDTHLGSSVEEKEINKGNANNNVNNDDLVVSLFGCISSTNMVSLLVPRNKTLSSTAFQNIGGNLYKDTASSSLSMWQRYNDWVVDGITSWTDQLQSTMNGDAIQMKKTVKKDMENNPYARFYFGPDRSNNEYDLVPSGGTPSPPFANVNSVLPLSGTMALLGNLLHAKLLDDERSDTVHMQRSTFLEFLHVHIQKDVQKQKIVNSILKFKDSNPRAKLCGLMLGWTMGGTENNTIPTNPEKEQIFCDIVLDIISRCCDITENNDSIKDQLAECDPVCVPAVLLKKAVLFALGGGLGHPPDMKEGKTMLKRFTKKMTALVQKMSSGNERGGIPMCDLFLFLQTLHDEMMFPLKKNTSNFINPRLTPRPGFLRHLKKNNERDETAESSLSKKGTEKKKKTKKKAKTGEDDEGEEVVMNIWISKAKQNAINVQIWADTQRKLLWKRKWQASLLPPKDSCIGPHPVVPRCISLLHIDLSYCSAIDDVALKHISVLCSNLRDIRLNNDVLITDNGKCVEMFRLRCFV